MSKMIIHNLTSLSDLETLKMCTSVVDMGKVSKGTYGEQYCFVSTFRTGHHLSCNKSKSGTYTFKIWDEK